MWQNFKFEYVRMWAFVFLCIDVLQKERMDIRTQKQFIGATVFFVVVMYYFVYFLILI